MNRILLGGLGIALGVFAHPALAQQPVPTGTKAPTRAATLGRPSAIPDPQPDSGITQTGLFPNRPSGQSRPTTTYAPGNFGTPIPVISQPPMSGGVPMSGMPVVQSTPPGSVAAPQFVPGAPSITESRDPTGRIPSGGVVVPSVAPGGYDCPVGLEDPLFTGAPEIGAIDRVARTHKAWVSGEVLLWWNRGSQVPPLVTTSSPQFNGIIGQGDTRVLLGGSFGDTYHVGGRIGAGYWFGDNECRGIDARVFWVSPTTATFSANTNQFPLLARPFFNINGTISDPNFAFGQSSEVIAGPGVATGSVTAAMKSTVWGGEINYRRYLAGTTGARLDLLAGYRYLDVSEQLTITERFARIPGSDPTVGIPAIAGTITDSFRTENQFHGGQIGVTGSFQRGRWSLDPRATVAFGTVHQTVEINGSQMLTFANGLTTTTPGGLLAVPGANIGRFSQDKFAVVPEVGLNIGWQATDRMKLFVGYNFLYLSSAVRPGEAIDTRLDAARVPNLIPSGSGVPLASPIRPQPQFSTSGYFIQGISFGLTYRW
ncbi:BBP7 family outer membrane beta-barrel protein [Gemmata sp. G18]|uniref:BBP7 family outer membrane beta-barrel protein n=1 Tax=Gemmata palustris TaxID=2822762 RepID=A0ABS5BZR8_9BACT|nr:BBP7 family outer membrane beta-barrel protein [Gemmata palustris]MBP3959226.1 BBP7 family outer membrane beta-barrel protein [Gemmata palustris]